MAAATPARRISRATGERAVAHFLDRVTRVKFHARGLTRLVLFGSMLMPEVEWLSDVDLAWTRAERRKDFDLEKALVFSVPLIGTPAVLPARVDPEAPKPPRRKRSRLPLLRARRAPPRATQ